MIDTLSEAEEQERAVAASWEDGWIEGKIEGKIELLTDIADQFGHDED